MRKFGLAFMMVAIVSLVSACQSRPEPKMDARTQVGAKQDITYKLGAGDKLRITIFNEDSISGEYEVDGSGQVSIKLIGAVQAKDRSLPQLSRDIEEKLRQGYLRNPQVSIDVMNYRPFFVLGEVNKPGNYPYVNGMTVLNAIALAGGYTYRARENNVIIVRGGDTNRQDQRADENTSVLPGDVIRVPERFF